MTLLLGVIAAILYENKRKLRDQTQFEVREI